MKLFKGKSEATEQKEVADSEWVSKVEEKKKQGENWAIRKQILINLNYYIGNQWIGWNEHTHSIHALPHDGQERITHNVLQQRVQTKLAKQTKNRIKYDVTPDTGDQTRIEVAKAATKFVHYWWDTEEMDKKTRDIFLNSGVKGYTAAKVFFDPEAGTDITPNKDEPGYEEGQQTINIGEICCRICDPLTLFIDPAATSDDEIRWVVEEKPRDIDYVEEKYGKKVTPDETVTYAPSFDISNSGYVDSTRKNKNMVMVREMWMKPCKKYPKGLKVTTTRSEFLDKDENAGDLPYILFGDIPVPGTPLYKSFLEAMLPIQRGLNIALTMFSTNLKKMGGTKWLVPIGSNVDEEELNDEISGIIHFNAATGGKVDRVSGADVPNGFDRIIEYYNRLIDDMSGVREISQGALPAGLDTASGLALMVEQENEKLAVTSQNYERGMKKLLKRVLQLMKKHYTEERLGRILGPDDEIELVSFTGSDLSGEEDINIIQGSSLPEMKSAQQDRIMTMWTANAILTKEGAPDANTFLKLMGLGDSTELFEQNQLDENKSKMENKTFQEMGGNQQALQMVQTYMQAKDAYSQQDQLYQQTVQKVQSIGGDPSQVPPPQAQPPQPIPGAPIVRDFYDHDIHIYNHNIFRKSSDYERLPPEMQALVDAHVQEHMDALQAPIIAQQQAEMETQQQQSQQQEQQSKEQHQRAVELKTMDNESTMQGELMKARTAIQSAQMRTASSQ